MPEQSKDAKQQRRKRHHSVTVGYLKRFTNESGLLWQYVRGQDEPVPVHPDDAGVEKYLYAPEVGDEPHDDSIEKWFADNVDATAPALMRKLVDEGELNGEDREKLALFLAFQELRIPRTRDAVTKSVGQLGTSMLQIMARRAPGRIRETLMSKGIELRDDEFEELITRYQAGDVELSPTKTTWLSILDVAYTTAPIISALTWTLVDAPRDFEFITSDAPVVKVLTDPNVPAIYGVGWISPSAEVTFALDPKHALLIKAGGSGTRGIGKPAWCRDVNARTVRQCNRFVYSHRREPFVPEIWRKARPPAA